MYLIKTKETYRFDNEKSLENFLEECKKSPKYELKKYSAEKKETKEDEYFLLSMEKEFNDIKDPISTVYINYTNTPDYEAEEEIDE